MTTGLKIRVIAIFLWVGFVCAISFMEAWIKFTAPGVTLATGLAIGQVVFGALNRVEITLAIVILATLFFRYQGPSWHTGIVFIAIGILCVQTFFILPEMSSRIDIYLAGGTPSRPSSLHSWYVAGELLKVITLSTAGFGYMSEEPALIKVKV